MYPHNYTRGDSFMSTSKINDFIADFVRLGTNGEDVYSFGVLNHNSHPDGVEVLEMPSKKRVTFWLPEASWNHSEKQESYGYPRKITMNGDLVIIGTDNHKIGNIYSFNLTSEMKNSKNGVPAEPTLCVENAFEHPQVYGKGNSIVSLPRDELEKIIRKI